ncbi:MBOAT family O-acyltransferase [Geitlerinema sp. PCC 9228]|uniref:MBOAT family O-acyltransferase n=1 Tax=Geitlerinema sp. PCC 9228 TaxID=111611 RepID=UPI0008F98E1C|nr:MBOAT family O-acyltransferase [Geitlerinema sp. PCC 9228]
MNFSAAPILYFCFLAAVFVVYWGVAWSWWRQLVVVVVSVAFYASLDWQYLPLLLVSTVLNFTLALAIANAGEGISEEAARHRHQTWLLSLGVGLNVLLLFLYKYGTFFWESVGSAISWSFLGEEAAWLQGSLVAPLGLSFFCFEFISYLVDVYRGEAPSRNPLKFAAYKLFFPKLVAGPITRYGEMEPQLRQRGFLPRSSMVVEGLWSIATGAIKKAILADRLAIYVNLTFENLQRAGSADLWMATVAYGLQLYLDFSGYVDIARGSAMLLGITLPQNFRFPYLSSSIADFWRRWHMTLGAWLRNYLYIPLGGSRRGLLRTCVNLIVVMLLAGLWHGGVGPENDPTGFLIWGSIHGGALALHRINDAIARKVGIWQAWWQTPPGICLGWGMTQATVFFAWIFFRLPEWQQSRWVVAHLWGYGADVQFLQKVYVETLGLDRLQLVSLLGLLGIGMVVAYAIQQRLRLQLKWSIKMFLVPLFLYAVWLFSPENTLPYIYFDF